MATKTTSNTMTEHEKQPVDTHIEKVDDLNQDHDQSNDLLKSRYDNLSIPRTLWLFKRSVFFVLMLYTGYMCEGFEVCQL